MGLCQAGWDLMPVKATAASRLKKTKESMNTTQQSIAFDTKTCPPVCPFSVQIHITSSDRKREGKGAVESDGIWIRWLLINCNRDQDLTKSYYFGKR